MLNLGFLSQNTSFELICKVTNECCCFPPCPPPFLPISFLPSCLQILHSLLKYKRTHDNGNPFLAAFVRASEKKKKARSTLWLTLSSPLPYVYPYTTLPNILRHWFLAVCTSFKYTVLVSKLVREESRLLVSAGGDCLQKGHDRMQSKIRSCILLYFIFPALIFLITNAVISLKCWKYGATGDI